MVSLLARPTASQNTTALADALIPALLAGNSPNATSTILPLLDGRTVSGTSNITRISAPASDSSTTPNRTVTGLTTTGTAGYSLSTCHWLVGPVSTEFVPTGLVRADYDYIALLNQSYFFYEAQRSGVLPPTNRVPWRQNSRLTDAAPGGQPLVGGQYDAGGKQFLELRHHLNSPSNLFNAINASWYHTLAVEQPLPSQQQVDNAITNLRPSTHITHLLQPDELDAHCFWCCDGVERGCPSHSVCKCCICTELHAESYSVLQEWAGPSSHWPNHVVDRCQSPSRSTRSAPSHPLDLRVYLHV